MEWQWIVARASGFTAYGLVSLAMILGLLLTQRWQSRSFWPRLINDQVHQYLIVLAGVFTLIHGVFVWLDPFTRFTWLEVLVPGTSHYRPLWMALGIVAAYLGFAIVVSGWLRPKIGYTWWRRLHYLNFAVWLLATLHGIGDGSDTHTPWAIDIYGLSTLVVLGLTIVRLIRPAGGERARPKPGWALLAGAAGVALAVFTLLGPLRPGWNAIANNGHGSGARIPLRVGVASAGNGPTASALPTSYTAAAQGSIRETQPNAQGIVTVQLALTLQAPTPEQLTIDLEGAPAEGGGVQMVGSSVAMGPPGNPTLYQGNIVQLRGDHFLATLSSPSQTPLQVAGQVQISPGGQVQGTVQVQPLAAGGQGE